MYRKSLLCLIAAGALAIPACGDDDPPSDDDGQGHGGTAGSGTGGSGKGGSSGSDGGEPGTGGTGKGGTAGKGGTGGTAGSAGDSGAGGGGGEAVPCEAGDPPQCADSSTILLCDPDADSTLQPFSCDDFCSELGLESGDCVADGADTTCACGDAVDQECFDGAEEVCSCLQGTEVECLTDADRFAWYRACVDGEAETETMVRCFAEGSARACRLTVEDCVP